MVQEFLLIVASVINGNVDNLQGQMFMGETTGTMAKNVLEVAVITPFFFIGFDVIPQAAEEINVPLKKIGKMMILSVVLAVVFYSFVILAVGYVLNPEEIALSQSTTGLVTADAMAKAFGTSVMAKVIIVGGMCGIVTSWNSFMIGGSRALYSMAESYMVPKVFAKLHPKHKTPVNALILIGILTMIAPFAGRVMMVWICDAGNFGCCLAYCMVSLSFPDPSQKGTGYAKTLSCTGLQICRYNGSDPFRLYGSGVLYPGFRRNTDHAGMDDGRCMESPWRCILCSLQSEIQRKIRQPY